VFNSIDQENSPETVVINRKMAETLWPGQDPLGKSMFAGEPGRNVTVVGVVADGKYEDLDEARRPFLYLALSQRYQGGIHVVARTGGDPRRWVESFDQAIRAQGLKTPVRPATFENWLSLSLLPQRMAAGVVAGLSGLGLLLAAMGLAGAVSYSVSQRKRELGIRVALAPDRGSLCVWYCGRCC
jgi:ABC-type antimicrobial peptide transport system permease subunit